MMENASKTANSHDNIVEKKSRTIFLLISSMLLVFTLVLILRWNYSSDGVNIVRAEAALTETKASSSELIDINTADVYTLTLLPGIGEVLAGRIVSYRDEHGAFLTVGDIMNVNGIGASKFGEIVDLITVNSEVSNENSGS